MEEQKHFFALYPPAATLAQNGVDVIDGLLAVSLAGFAKALAGTLLVTSSGRQPAALPTAPGGRGGVSGAATRRAAGNVVVRVLVPQPVGPGRVLSLSGTARWLAPRPALLPGVSGWTRGAPGAMQLAAPAGLAVSPAGGGRGLRLGRGT